MLKTVFSGQAFRNFYGFNNCNFNSCDTSCLASYGAVWCLERVEVVQHGKNSTIQALRAAQGWFSAGVGASVAQGA